VTFLKIGLTFLFGASLTFGVDQAIKQEDVPRWMHSEETYEEEYDQEIGFCHGYDQDFFFHMFEDLSLEEQAMVNAKLGALLEESGISLEAFEENPHDYPEIMYNLMDYLEEEGFDFSHYEDDFHHRGMGMH